LFRVGGLEDGVMLTPDIRGDGTHVTNEGKKEDGFRCSYYSSIPSDGLDLLGVSTNFLLKESSISVLYAGRLSSSGVQCLFTLARSTG
jgi:hypothetical protein